MSTETKKPRGILVDNGIVEGEVIETVRADGEITFSGLEANEKLRIAIRTMTHRIKNWPEMGEFSLTTFSPDKDSITIKLVQPGDDGPRKRQAGTQRAIRGRKNQVPETNPLDDLKTPQAPVIIDPDTDVGKLRLRAALLDYEAECDKINDLHKERIRALGPSPSLEARMKAGEQTRLDHVALIAKRDGKKMSDKEKLSLELEQRLGGRSESAIAE
jgi:hypothetical protein